MSELAKVLNEIEKTDKKLINRMEAIVEEIQLLQKECETIKFCRGHLIDLRDSVSSKGTS